MVQKRLLDIALREFGDRGLDGASTRQIAAAAGTAMSSITYHYGGKEGLYRAAANHVACEMGEEWAERLPALGIGGAAEARAGIHTILQALTDKMSAPATETWALFIAREQIRPTEAFEELYRGMMGQVLEKLADLVCRATGNDEGTTARIVVVTLFGQVVALRSSRAAAMKLMGGSIDLAGFKARLAANTDAILDRLIAEQKGQA